MSEEQEIGAVETGGVPLWKKALLGLAVLSLIVGFVLKAQAQEVSTNQGGMSNVAGGSSLVGTDRLPGIDGSAEEGDSLSSYSPMFLKGGFSFLIAFCMGMALRMFFKVSAILVGVVALATFGLQKAGVVDVDWASISEWWDSVSGKVMEKAQGFKGFVTGNLPSAGLGVLGLLTGFKKG